MRTAIKRNRILFSTPGTGYNVNCMHSIAYHSCYLMYKWPITTPYCDETIFVLGIGWCYGICQGVG